MGNKFIKQYPQLWEPKVGDRVRIVQLLDCSKVVISHIGDACLIGEVGKIVVLRPTHDGLYTVNFGKDTNYFFYREEFILSSKYHG